MEIEDFHLLLQEIPKQEEAGNEFNSLIENDPALVLGLLVTSIQKYKDITVKIAITLLGRTAKLLSQDFPSIGDENFHNTFQASLLSLIESPINDYELIPNLSYSISRFASLYEQSSWPDLCISLLQFIIHPEEGLVTPSALSPLSSYIATDVLWLCINNDSILLDQEDIIQQIINFIEIILENPTSVDGHQLISTVRLIFAVFSKTDKDNPYFEQLLTYAEPIVDTIPQLSQEMAEEYLGAISNFTDSNLSFFRAHIENFINILISFIEDFENTTKKSLNRCIDILHHIISYDLYYQIILPKSLEIYQLFLNVIANSKIDLDPEFGFHKSNTIENTEDAILALSECFSEALIENCNVCYEITDLFTECLKEDNNINYIVANLIGFSSAIRCSSNLIYCYYLNSSEILPIFQEMIPNDDPKLRIISADALKTILKLVSEIYNQFDGEEYIPLICETIANENDEIVMTYLLKTLKVYLKNFNDFVTFSNDIMELLGSKFDEINEEHKILVFECYYFISIRLKDEFNQYMEPILEFVENLFDEFDPENSNNLFYKCLELAPKFPCLGKSDFDSISQTILTFISTITDFSQLSSKEMDSINGAICSILKRDPEQFMPHASAIVNLIFEFALVDIEYESVPRSIFEMEYRTENFAIFNHKTNMVDVYSYTSINMVTEGINTLRILIANLDEIVKIEGFFENIVNFIQKNLGQNSFCFKIVRMTSFLVIDFVYACKNNGLLLNLFEENGDELPVVFGFFSDELALLSMLLAKINDLQSFDNNVYMFENFKNLFVFICVCYDKLSSNEETQNLVNVDLFTQILNKTLTMIVFVLNKNNMIRSNCVRLTTYGNDYDDINSVESIVGSLFGYIFSCMSNLLSSDLIQTFCEKVFVLQPIEVKDGLFISEIVLDFWIYVAILYPEWTKDQASQILENIQAVLTENECNLEMNEVYLATMARIVVGLADPDEKSDDSNRYGFYELIEPTIQFLNEFFENQKYAVYQYAKYLCRQLLIMANRVLQNQEDPSFVIQRLIGLMPIQLIDKGPFFMDIVACKDDEDLGSVFWLLSSTNERAAEALLSLVDVPEIELLQSSEGMQTVVVMAALLCQNVSDMQLKNRLIGVANRFLGDKEIGPQLMDDLAETYKDVVFQIDDILSPVRIIK